jgi:uncharacterized protein YceK
MGLARTILHQYTQDGKEGTGYSVQAKQFLVMMVFAMLLSGCGGKLQLAEQRPGLPTATPGIAEKGQQGDPAGVPAAPELTTAPPVETAIPPVDAAAEVIEPTLPPAPPVEPTLDPTLANVQLPLPADLETRWREMQVERTTFDPRPYTTPSYQIVWWFDPVFGQILPIGQLRGDFTVQATFRIKGHWVTALEMPYHINQEYEIVVPEAILQRMRDAGKTEWAEVFIYQTNDIQPK